MSATLCLGARICRCAAAAPQLTVSPRTPEWALREIRTLPRRRGGGAGRDEALETLLTAA